ncbi:MAG: protoporphyrinogen oxidase HemJ [Pseudomonadales bacterium]|nr:protoporphyrinogen oxidase HemJ [Pseudomonadales bacterium]
MQMLWIKAFHIIAVICWFAGIFYLPRLFVYHAMASDTTSIERFKIMERKLYRGIMTPSAIIAIVLGLWMVIDGWDYYQSAVWLQIKLFLVLGLIGYHGYCGKLLKTFAADNNDKSDVFYRWFNEIPVIILVAIVILAIVKPFT